MNSEIEYWYSTKKLSLLWYMLIHLVLVVVLICSRMNYCICSENWTKTCETVCVFCFQVFFCSFFMVHQDIEEREKLVVFFVVLLSFRFALVGVGSEASSKKLMDLLPKRELHGQNPVVTPCNKQFLSQFEMQSRKSKLFSCTLLEK